MIKSKHVPNPNPNDPVPNINVYQIQTIVYYKIFKKILETWLLKFNRIPNINQKNLENNCLNLANQIETIKD